MRQDCCDDISDQFVLTVLISRDLRDHHDHEVPDPGKLSVYLR
jgi:hypothetical protein